MTTITTANVVVTLINVFTVEPQQQQRLVDLLVTATETVIGKQPGFVSANIHKSLDGTRVANYAQWRSREDFEAMLTNPEAAAHMRQAAKIATFDAHLYEIAFIDHASWHCHGPAASSAGRLDRLPARQGSPADPLIASPALAPSRIGKGRMTTITTDNEVVTLIDVFTVESEHQQRLVDVLVTATETMVGKQPGFVSASIHKSLDGRRVANYTQFRSQEALEAMLAKPEAAVHMREAAKIGSFDAHLYEVVFIDHAS